MVINAYLGILTQNLRQIKILVNKVLSQIRAKYVNTMTEASATKVFINVNGVSNISSRNIRFAKIIWRDSVLMEKIVISSTYQAS